MPCSRGGRAGVFLLYHDAREIACAPQPQEHGEITTHHSRALAESTMHLDDTAATTVEQAVLPRAPEQTLASFRRSLRRVVLNAAPETADERHERGMAERRVVRTPVDDAGMSGIWMLLPDTARPCS